MADVKRTHNLRQNAGRIDSALKRALTAGALIVVSDAKKNAPEDTGTMTRLTKASRPRWRRGRLEVSVGTSVRYGVYHELPKYIRGTRLGPKSEAKGAVRPWLRPALRDNKDEIVGIVRGFLMRELRRISL